MTWFGWEPRLILEYSAEDNAFVGTLQNTTDETLPQVRVEVACVQRRGTRSHNSAGT